jgi:hypothetical protein
MIRKSNGTTRLLTLHTLDSGPKYAGKTFGLLTIISREIRKHGSMEQRRQAKNYHNLPQEEQDWLCVCNGEDGSCGKLVIHKLSDVVRAFQRGQSPSCGCNGWYIRTEPVPLRDVLDVLPEWGWE